MNTFWGQCLHNKCTVNNFMVTDEVHIFAHFSNAMPNASTGRTLSGVVSNFNYAPIIRWDELGRGL